MKRFIWSCTKFLGGLILILIGVCLMWAARGDGFSVVGGYAAVTAGLLWALCTYGKGIRPALKQENSENKE